MEDWQLTEYDDLEPADEETNDPPIIVAARDGVADEVRALVAAGVSADTVDSGGMSPICWAACRGHADIVDMLLTIGANRHIGGGPGWWAYMAPKGIQWDVLAVTRADPALVELWRSGGLPVERRDNYTMTELSIKDQPAVTIASADPANYVPGLARNIEIAREGGDLIVYRGFGDGISERFDRAANLTVKRGAIVVPAQMTDQSAQLTPLRAIRCGSVLIKGPLTQLGFAHYSLRHWIAQAGYRDAGRELREVFHYFEGDTSDANIVELQVEIER